MNESTRTIEDLANRSTSTASSRTSRPTRLRRAERGRRPPDLGEEERAGVHAGVAAQGVPPLADDGAMAGSRTGRTSAIRRSTTRTSSTTRRPKQKDGRASLDEVDPELLRDLREARHPARRSRSGSRGVAVDAVFDSVSVGDHVQGEAGRARHHLLLVLRGGAASIPSWCEKYLGSVVPYTDNFFAALNSAVFTDGSFCYVPKGVRCPMELSTYFRINAADTGQFERTLIIADEGAYVSYLEGCTAPMRDENQLHAAVVELIALDDAQIKYSTVQNWYAGRQGGQGRHLQLRHQARQVRAAPTRRSRGRRWRPARRSPGSTRACILQGDDSVGEFYSVALTTTTSRPTPAPR